MNDQRTSGTGTDTTAPPAQEPLADQTAGHGTELLPESLRQEAAAAGTTEADAGEPPGDGPLWQRMAAARFGDGPVQRLLGWLVLGLALGLGAFQLTVTATFALDARQQRLIHLLIVLVLVFLVVPPSKRAWGRHPLASVGDLGLVAASAVVTAYPLLNAEALAARTGAFTTTDWVMGAVLTVLLMEAARRTVGWFMSALVLGFLFYAWAGPWFPGQFQHGGATVQRLSTHVYLGGDGILGLTLGVVVTFVFIFVLFGALLQKTGGGNFFIGLAYCLTGRARGGPAKGAVVGSAMMGSISGTAIGNVATTAPFTIPMMKKVGYKKEEAAGLEAAASTGGQILPPIRGAGAFLMAERTGIPYADIVKVSIIPALMYFGTVYLFVDILARKYGIGGMSRDQLPRLGALVKAGWHFLLPLVLLVVLLLQYVPPGRAGLFALGALLVVAMARSASRLSAKEIAEVFTMAARNTLPVSVACAVAGVIVGVVGLTGLGLVISDVLVTAFAGSLIATILMVALASLVLGVGLPVTASYVVLIILAGPALETLGLAVIVAHMIVYWYSQDSNVTPPVALAAFVAAGIAGSRPMMTALHAWKFAKGLYLIPLLMAYSALMLTGSRTEVVVSVVTGCVALIAAAAALEGYLRRPTRWWERTALTLSAAMIFIAPEFTGWTAALTGADVPSSVFVWGGTAAALALILQQVITSRGAGDAVAPEAAPVAAGDAR